MCFFKSREWRPQENYSKWWGWHLRAPWGPLLRILRLDRAACGPPKLETAQQRPYTGDIQVPAGLFHHYRRRTEPTHSCRSMVGNAGIMRLRSTALLGPPQCRDREKES